MDSVNKTLYIPLYGKALVSRRNLILRDPKAEEIWAAEGFSLSGKSKSKWLAYYMGMRAAVFDRWVQQQMEDLPEAVVLHLGCGMDSRECRIGTHSQLWVDVDFPQVIAEREKYYRQAHNYRMVSGDLRQADWLEQIPGRSAIVVMEGVSMYLAPAELAELLKRLTDRFSTVRLLLDCYTELGARASRVRNPINDVGVTQVYGLDDPQVPVTGSKLVPVRELCMTPEDLIRQLPGLEQPVFRVLFAGKIATSMYRMYAYESVAGHAD